MAFLKLFKGVRGVLTIPYAARHFSKGLGPERFDNFIIRNPVKEDYEEVVKGVHKYLTLPDSKKRKTESKSCEKSSNKEKGKVKIPPVKGIGNKQVRKLASELQDCCSQNGYTLAIAATNNDKNDTKFTKVCGSAGLYLNAEEVKKFNINDQRWIPRGTYGLVCNLWVLLEARRRGIGTALIEYLIKLARKNGVKMIYSIVDSTKKRPKNIHLEVGFQEVKRDDTSQQILLAKVL